MLAAINYGERVLPMEAGEVPNIFVHGNAFSYHFFGICHSWDGGYACVRTQGFLVVLDVVDSDIERRVSKDALYPAIRARPVRVFCISDRRHCSAMMHYRLSFSFRISPSTENSIGNC